jgi:succinate dehydrogenase hydrophobic anchor subunit
MEKVFHHVRKIRQQPEHVRRHILHVLIIICGVILILLWIYSLGMTLTSDDTKAKVSQDLKPFSVLKANLMGE